MTVFEEVDIETKKKMVSIWKKMNQEQKDHFVNQVALALSIWDSDEKGKRLVAEILSKVVRDGSNTLSDFGLYLEEYEKSADFRDKRIQIKRAVTIVENYRVKHALSSVPHKEV